MAKKNAKKQNTISATINGVLFEGLTVEQASALAEMAADTGMANGKKNETRKRKPNGKRVVNANRCKYESVSGVPVVDCKRFEFWPIVNDAKTVTVIETEIAKQRKAGYKPEKVVIQGYRVIVKIGKKSADDKYSKIKRGKLRSFHELEWVYSPREAGYFLDLNTIER